MRTSAVATRPGEPTATRDFTAAEETARDAEEVATLVAEFGEMKLAKQDQFVAEGVKRIAAQVPDWDTLAQIKTISGIWTSHLAANATSAQLTAKDIYLYVRDTVPPKIAAVTTEAELASIDPTLADPFRDGTPWPI